jgi:DNA-binding NtrC family response regulator
MSDERPPAVPGFEDEVGRLTALVARLTAELETHRRRLLGGGLAGLTVREMERRLIAETLAHTNDNRTQAAKILGISIRTLRNKLAGYRRGQAPSREPGI